MKLVRWGWSEYESPELPGLPEGVEAVAAPVGEGPVEGAEVVVVPSTTRITAADVPRLRSCRLLVSTTSGMDHLDLTALASAGIPVCRLPLARRDAVVETALAMMLSLTRRLGPFQEAAREGRWERAALAGYGATLLGTVGVFGVGVIGSRMAEVLEALGARCLRHDPALEESVPFGELLETSDVITLHCELTSDTRGLFGREVLGRMRRGAVLVNTARGKVLDVEAALDAVDRGALAGLGLDVFPEEPAALRRLVRPNVIVTPHAAGWHPGLGAAIAGGVARAVRALVEGAPLPWRVV